LAFGIESADEEVLKICRKKINLDKVKKIARLAKKKGFILYGFFIIGLPGETDEGFQRTLDYARSLNLDIANFCMAVPFIGTELYRMIDKKGRFLVDTTRNISSGFYDEKVFYEYEGSKEDDILRRYRRAYKEFYSLKKKIKLLLKCQSFTEIRWYLDAGLIFMRNIIRDKLSSKNERQL